MDLAELLKEQAVAGLRKIDARLCEEAAVQRAEDREENHDRDERGSGSVHGALGGERADAISVRNFGDSEDFQIGEIDQNVNGDGDEHPGEQSASSVCSGFFTSPATKLTADHPS